MRFKYSWPRLSSLLSSLSLLCCFLQNVIEPRRRRDESEQAKSIKYYIKLTKSSSSCRLLYTQSAFEGNFFFFFLKNKIVHILAGYTFVVWHPAAYSYLLFSIRRSSTKDRSGFYSFWWTFPLIFSIREPFMMR